MACKHILHKIGMKRLKSCVCTTADSCSMSVAFHQFNQAEQYGSTAHGSEHTAIPFDLQCLKFSSYDCVTGRIPVIERSSQHSLLNPVRQPRHRFYHHSAANSDSAYWNCAPTSFLFAPVTSSHLC